MSEKLSLAIENDALGGPSHDLRTLEQPKQNTDRELWRESDDRSQCTPSIHVTQDGHIGINVGGTVITRTIREWHDLAVKADLSAAGINMTEASNRLHNIVSQHRRAEPPQPAKEAHASPSREWISKMADGEDKRPSVSARNPDAVETQPDASGVERWEVYPVPGEPWLHNIQLRVKGVVERRIENYSGNVVTAADHDRVVADLQRQLQIREAEIGIGGSPPPYPTWMQQVADRDATIAELRADRQYCFDQMKASDTRAEAAEAKCAEYRNTFTAANEMRLSEVRLRHQVQQRADALTAQLAAATEKLRVVEGECERLRVFETKWFRGDSAMTERKNVVVPFKSFDADHCYYLRSSKTERCYWMQNATPSLAVLEREGGGRFAVDRTTGRYNTVGESPFDVTHQEALAALSPGKGGA